MPLRHGLGWPALSSKRALDEKQIVAYFRNHYLNLCSLLHVSRLWHPFSMQPDSLQTSHFCAEETPCWPLRAHYGRGTYKIVMAGHEGWSVGGGHPEDVIAGLILEWGPRESKAPHPLPCPWNIHSVYCSHSGTCSKDISLRVGCYWDPVAWIHD